MPLKEILEKFIPRYDHLQHEHIGLIICLAFIFIPWWAVIILAAVIGIGYEIYQKKTNTGEFDLKDAFWVVYPSLIISTIINLMPWVPKLF